MPDAVATWTAHNAESPLVLDRGLLTTAHPLAVAVSRNAFRRFARMPA